MNRREFILLSAVATGSSFLAGAGRAQEDLLVEAAKRDGEVNWYSSLVVDTAIRPIAAAFQKKYGIRVNTVPGKVGDLLLKVNNELKAGHLQADVFHGATTLQNLRKQNEVSKFQPQAAKHYPPELIDPDGYWTAQEINFEGPACNTDLVPDSDAPKTYQDLLDPRWTGKIAWAAAMEQGGPPGFIATVLALMGHDKGIDYLERLSKQKLISVATNQRALLDSVALGEFPLALSIYSHHVGIIRRDGAPVRFLPLQPKVSSTIDPVYLLAKAARPNAGKLLIEFICSREGQMILRSGGYNPSFPEYRDSDANYNAYAITPNAVSENIEQWIAIYRRLFG